MKTKTLHQSYVFQAEPHDVYEALMDSKKHSEFTGAEATISRKIGGKFTTWDDYASGENVDLIVDKKIVQKWRAADWPKDHYSFITFEFKKKNQGTSMDFTQTDIPEEAYEDVAQGWIDWYWEKLKEYFSKK
jgi:activator of HSP90 ATPase